MKNFQKTIQTTTEIDKDQFEKAFKSSHTTDNGYVMTGAHTNYSYVSNKLYIADDLAGNQFPFLCSKRKGYSAEMVLQAINAYVQGDNQLPSIRNWIRAMASQYPATALHFARDVDQAGHPLTRAAACGSPDCAVNYAIYVDRGYHPQTFAGVMAPSGVADQYRYLREVDNIPEEKCRELILSFCKNTDLCSKFLSVTKEYLQDYPQVVTLEEIIAIAEEADSGSLESLAKALGPNEVMRSHFCSSPQLAFRYGFVVDEGPHPLTREAVCRLAPMALQYANKVEKGVHPDTFAAVKGTTFEVEYVLNHGSSKNSSKKNGKVVI